MSGEIIERCINKEILWYRSKDAEDFIEYVHNRFEEVKFYLKDETGGKRLADRELANRFFR
jgi:hypothetical protein